MNLISCRRNGLRCHVFTTVRLTVDVIEGGGGEENRKCDRGSRKHAKQRNANRQRKDYNERKTQRVHFQEVRKEN